MEDRLHQPYRMSLIQGMEELIPQAKALGALNFSATLYHSMALPEQHWPLLHRLSTPQSCCPIRGNTGAFGKSNVSIAQFVQKNVHDEEAEMVLITENVLEKDFRMITRNQHRMYPHFNAFFCIVPRYTQQLNSIQLQRPHSLHLL